MIFYVDEATAWRPWADHFNNVVKMVSCIDETLTHKILWEPGFADGGCMYFGAEGRHH